MGWSHPDISLEDVLNLIKEFVDIIILASGYQSSGVAAIWDPSNIKKALQWGLFFEDVFGGLCVSDDPHGSVKELDAALLEMKHNPYFPQGLSDLSYATLTRARDFVARHIMHTLPLRDDHLNALLTSTVQMDLDDLRMTEYECLNVYLEKLRFQSTSNNPQLRSAVPQNKTKENDSACFSEYIIQELSVRQVAVSCVSSVELGLDVLSESATNMCKGISRNAASLLSEEQFTEYAAKTQWRSRNLSYLLDKRTVRLISGAKLIFSAPKVQWLQVFERLKISNEGEEDCLQTIGIFEYLTASLSKQLHLLWKLAPVLAAIAIPLWSPLFRLYMCEIETQFKGDSSTIRCCSCVQDGKKHIDCELGERIWCLYVFHIQGSHLVNTTNSQG